MKCPYCFGDGYLCPYCYGTGEAKRPESDSRNKSVLKPSWMKQSGNLDGSKSLIQSKRQKKVFYKPKKVKRLNRLNKYLPVSGFRKKSYPPKILISCNSCGHKIIITEKMIKDLNERLSINISLSNIHPLKKHMRKFLCSNCKDKNAILIVYKYSNPK
jgi:hypothetical protein